MACGKNTKEKALIQKLRFDLEARKKTFGVDYMNKVKAGADEEELKLVLETASKDIEEFERQIKEKEDIIEGNTAEAQKKIETNKSGGKPATETTPAPAPVAEPNPAAEATSPLKTAPSDEPTPTSAVTVEQ